MTFIEHSLCHPILIKNTQLGIPLSYKQKCISEIYKLGDAMDYTTNVHASMSSWKVWNQTKVFNKLLDNIYLTCLKATDGLTKNELVIEDCWSAIYKKGEYTKSHFHYPAFLSFVYYLQTSEVNTPIIFNELDFKIYPKDDMLVIFPSYVFHEVPKHLGNQDRIVLAGNLQLKKHVGSNYYK